MISTLITVVMFLRMHHIHGTDTSVERGIIVIGTIVFLIQAGLSYQIVISRGSRLKNALLTGNLLLMMAYATLFFWFVDFNRDSIFSTLLGTQ
jgi:hypothetical protein